MLVILCKISYLVEWHQKWWHQLRFDYLVIILTMLQNDKVLNSESKVIEEWGGNVSVT